MEYWHVPALSSIYLEDSFVLEIVEEPAALKFRLEVVLTESHPAYRPPKPNEQYCYADAWLVFVDVTELDWIERSDQHYTDASGEEDMGNIHYLKRSADHWLAGGDWGEVRICTPSDPLLHLAG